MPLPPATCHVPHFYPLPYYLLSTYHLLTPPRRRGPRARATPTPTWTSSTAPSPPRWATSSRRSRAPSEQGLRGPEDDATLYCTLRHVGVPALLKKIIFPLIFPPYITLLAGRCPLQGLRGPEDDASYPLCTLYCTLRHGGRGTRPLSTAVPTLLKKIISLIRSVPLRVYTPSSAIVHAREQAQDAW